LNTQRIHEEIMHAQISANIRWSKFSCSCSYWAIKSCASQH